MKCSESAGPVLLLRSDSHNPNIHIVIGIPPTPNSGGIENFPVSLQAGLPT